MLEINNANKSFGPKDLFRHFTATAATGRITALTGISGSGKSTLLNCIGGLDTLDSGSIEFAGTAITGLSKSKLRALRQTTIGYLFQDYALIPEQTVRNNLILALPRDQRTLLGAATKPGLRAIDTALTAVGLEGYASREVYALSGGEQQRVAVARLLLRTPSLILADEPTGALDAANRDVVLQHLRTLADDSATVLISTHDPAVTEFSDAEIRL